MPEPASEKNLIKGIARRCKAVYSGPVDINPAALRTIRQRSGMSVTALAEAAGIKQAHLSNIEAGRRRASAEVAVALAGALKIELPAILANPGRVA